MSLTTTEKIYLDFYNQNIVTVTAKQFDTSSRYINLICTDHGKRVFLNSEHVSAYVKYEKPDKTFVFNDTLILEDGTIYIEFTQQMLASQGRSKVDILITSLTNVPATNLSDMDSIYKMGATVISTMSFYLNVLSSSLDEEDIVSVPEFSALNNALARLAITEKKMLDLDEMVNENETERQNQETIRITNENQRITAETERQSLFGDKDDSAEDQTVYGVFNSSSVLYEDASELYEETTTLLGEPTDTSDKDTLYGVKQSLIEIENEVEQNIVDWDNRITSIENKTGLISIDEKGRADGVATLDRLGYVPESQLDLINNSQLIELINSLHKVHFNDVVDNSIGKDGDILMIPLPMV